MKENELEQSKLKDLDFPQNAFNVLQKHIKKPLMSMLIPKCEQYLYTQIFEMTETDAYKQEAFLHDFRRYNEWKLS